MADLQALVEELEQTKINEPDQKMITAMLPAVAEVLGSPELLKDILELVPIKTLLRCKSVCKAFNNLLAKSDRLQKALFVKHALSATKLMINPLVWCEPLKVDTWGSYVNIGILYPGAAQDVCGSLNKERWVFVDYHEEASNVDGVGRERVTGPWENMILAQGVTDYVVMVTYFYGDTDALPVAWTKHKGDATVGKVLEGL